MPYMKSLDEQLWDRCEQDLATGCINWTGPVNSSGYGGVSRGGKIRGAHVLAWEEVNGPITDGSFVCHHCDNPRCCNHEHMFLGDLALNALDMHMKNRHPRHNAWTHATPEERAARASKISSKSLGRPKNENMRSKLAATATGRKRKTLPNGKWTWEYPAALDRSA